MPELPEVETARRGLEPHLVGVAVDAVVLRRRRLRWPIPRSLEQQLPGSIVTALERRAKYLLMRTDTGTALLHLGMSGSLRVLRDPPPPGPHDHVDLRMADGCVLRFNDPRRFGALLWTRRDPYRHPLLRALGPEPLGPGFDAEHLHALSRGRRAAVKSFLMDGRVVVGVGNIYASEALWRAGIHPRRPAGRIALPRYARLVDAVRAVLAEAIAAGGTTLRDFTRADGEPGYFHRELSVYGRDGEACPRCGETLRSEVIAQRNTYLCVGCQR